MTSDVMNNDDNAEAMKKGSSTKENRCIIKDRGNNSIINVFLPVFLTLKNQLSHIYCQCLGTKIY